MDWKDCDLVEVVPGKVSGAPVVRGTRVQADAVVENYESSLDEGMSPDAAVAEINENFPSVSVKTIRELLAYAHAHNQQPRL